MSSPIAARRSQFWTSIGALALLGALAPGCFSSGAPAVPQGEPAADASNCIGVNPALAAKPALPSAPLPEGCKAGTCVGQYAPAWEAYDFQPLSCGFKQKYGMKDFAGKVTVLVHLAGWCGYCQQQTFQLEKLRIELQGNQVPVNMLIVNASNASSEEQRAAVVNRCSIPVFQDHEDFGIWAANGGGKDDIYLYDRQGKLLEYLAHDPKVTNLSDPKLFAAFRDKIKGYVAQSGAAGEQGNSGSTMPGDTGAGSTATITDSTASSATNSASQVPGTAVPNPTN